MGLVEVKDLCGEAGRLCDEGKGKAAKQAAEKAVSLCAQSPGKDHHAYVLSLCALGWASREAGDDAGATAAFGEAVERARDLEEMDVEYAVRALDGAAEFLAELGKDKESRELTRESTALLEQQLGAEHPRVAVRRVVE